MRSRFYKWFWIWELLKEEAWINEMAEHGYGLIAPHRLRYDFDNIEPGQYRYKEVFMRGSANSTEVVDFLKLLEEMDIKDVGHVSFPGHTIVYLQCPKTEEDIELFSDLDSKIEYEKMLCGYLWALIVVNFIAALLNLIVFFSSIAVDRPQYGNIVGFLSLGLLIACIVAWVKKRRKIKEYEKERTIHE